MVTPEALPVFIALPRTARSLLVKQVHELSSESEPIYNLYWCTVSGHEALPWRLGAGIARLRMLPVVRTFGCVAAFIFVFVGTASAAD
jgi:hypothetical protein